MYAAKLLETVKSTNNVTIIIIYTMSTNIA